MQSYIFFCILVCNVVDDLYEVPVPALEEDLYENVYQETSSVRSFNIFLFFFISVKLFFVSGRNFLHTFQS